MKRLFVSVAMLAPVAAIAAPRAQVGGELDIYLVPTSTIEVSNAFGSGEADGDGFGIKGYAPVSDTLNLTGEYQSVGYDDGGGDVDQLRAGIEVALGASGGLGAEYVAVDADGSDVAGFGFHWRFDTALTETLGFFGSAGFLLLEDDDADDDLSGFEGLVGLDLSFAGNMSGFIDYRFSLLEYDDADTDLDLSDLRLGLRLHF